MMKKKIIIIMILMTAVSLFLYGSTYSKNGYITLRTTKATEDTQLTSSTQQTAPDSTDDGTVYITPDVGFMHVRFLMTAATDTTMSWTLWAYKSVNDPAKYVAHGTAVSGETQTGNTNEFYADTITITDHQWHKIVSKIDGAPDTIISGGGIAELQFDTCEYPYWKIIIRDIAGGGVEATTAGAEFTTFK